MSIVNLQRALLRWYVTYHRDLPWRRTSDPWAILVSEIMLQQTRVETVIPAYERFMTRYPTPTDLAVSSDDDLYRLWQGQGYYSRARHLREAARIIAAQGWPRDAVAMRALPGVGPYTVAALGSIAFGWPLACVDGNVKRVYARLKALDAPLGTPPFEKAVQELADEHLVREDPGTWNQAVMELGALVCLPRQPKCGECPLRALCEVGGTSRATDFPVRRAAKAIPTRYHEVFLIRREGKVLVWRRPAKGLLGGLWEFPWAESPSEDAIITSETLSALRIHVSSIRPIGSHRHAYTHFRLFLRYWELLDLQSDFAPPGTVSDWIDLSALASLPMHRAMEPLRQFVLNGTESP